MLEIFEGIFRKNIEELIKEAYSQGFTKGWTLAMQHKESSNKDFIASTTVDNQVDEILRQQGF